MKVQIYSVEWIGRVDPERMIKILFIGNLNSKNPIDPEIFCKRYINDNGKHLDKIVGERRKHLKFEGIFEINRYYFWEEIEQIFPNYNYTERRFIDDFDWDL